MPIYYQGRDLTELSAFENSTNFELFESEYRALLIDLRSLALNHLHEEHESDQQILKETESKAEEAEKAEREGKMRLLNKRTKKE